eukprot:g2501.t1
MSQQLRQRRKSKRQGESKEENTAVEEASVLASQTETSSSETNQASDASSSTSATTPSSSTSSAPSASSTAAVPSSPPASPPARSPRTRWLTLLCFLGLCTLWSLVCLPLNQNTLSLTCREAKNTAVEVPYVAPVWYRQIFATVAGTTVGPWGDPSVGGVSGWQENILPIRHTHQWPRLHFIRVCPRMEKYYKPAIYSCQLTVTYSLPGDSERHLATTCPGSCEWLLPFPNFDHIAAWLSGLMLLLALFNVLTWRRPIFWWASVLVEWRVCLLFHPTFLASILMLLEHWTGVHAAPGLDAEPRQPVGAEMHWQAFCISFYWNAWSWFAVLICCKLLHWTYKEEYEPESEISKLSEEDFQKVLKDILRQKEEAKKKEKAAKTETAKQKEATKRVEAATKKVEQASKEIEKKKEETVETVKRVEEAAKKVEEATKKEKERRKEEARKEETSEKESTKKGESVKEEATKKEKERRKEDAAKEEARKEETSKKESTKKGESGMGRRKETRRAGLLQQEKILSKHTRISNKLGLRAQLQTSLTNPSPARTSENHQNSLYYMYEK